MREEEERNTIINDLRDDHLAVLRTSAECAHRITLT